MFVELTFIDDRVHRMSWSSDLRRQAVSSAETKHERRYIHSVQNQEKYGGDGGLLKSCMAVVKWP